jgi:hypothetical protein
MYQNKHEIFNTETTDQIILDSDGVGIVPVKLFPERSNPAEEWKMTSKHESTMKNT